MEPTDPGRSVTREEYKQLVRVAADLQKRVKVLEAAQSADDARWSRQTKDIGRQGWGRVAALIAILVPLLPLANALLGPLLAKHDIDPATLEAVAAALERIEAGVHAGPAKP
mgnify:CR=1 FL=1